MVGNNDGGGGAVTSRSGTEIVGANFCARIEEKRKGRWKNGEVRCIFFFF